MEQLYGSRNMRLIDQYSIEEAGIPSAVLMERAALAVADTIVNDCPEAGTLRICAVCGTGNNAGDAMAVMRILGLRGYHVSCILAGGEGRLSPEAARQLSILRKIGFPAVNAAEDPDTAFCLLQNAGLIVDGMFGIGLDRPVTGAYAEWIHRINESGLPVYAVDIPSGVHTDSGRIMGCAVNASVTVTFGYAKPGLYLYPGASCSGRVAVAEIGFVPAASGRIEGLTGPDALALTDADVPLLMYHRDARSNKGSFGHALIIAGSAEMGGAAVLAAQAAYRSGCGLVRVWTHACNRQLLLNALPEAIVSVWDETRDFPAQDLIDALKWASSVCIGPGIGTGPVALRMLELVRTHCSVPVVADADALNLMAIHPSLMAGWRAPLVVTPHPGEMARLTGKSVSDITDAVRDVCTAFALQYSCVCVLKDAATVISDGSTVYINRSGNHGMATGGSGDVLTGLITGLLCNCPDLLKASALGCFLHGRAGDAAAAAGDPYRLLASDLLTWLRF